MNVLKCALSLSLLAGMAAWQAPAEAALFTEDFESPVVDPTAAVLALHGVNDWDSNGAMIWRPGAGSVPSRWNQAEPMAGPAGGNQIAFVNPNLVATIDTGVVIQANTVYTLSAAIGWDNLLPTHGSWSLQLWANNPTLGVDPGEQFIDQTYSTLAGVNNPTQGNWATNSISWDSASDPGLVGSTLSVLLNNFAAGDTVYFDNIEITAVPEPGSLALLGMGTLLVARRRRRD